MPASGKSPSTYGHSYVAKHTTTPSLPVVNTQPEERESPGAEDTLWAVRASFEIRRLRRLSRGSADPREL